MPRKSVSFDFNIPFFLLEIEGNGQFFGLHDSFCDY